LLLLIAANIYSYLRVEPPCCDLTGPFGFPFTLGWFGGFFGSTSFMLSGLITNTLFAVVASAFLGWAFAKVWPRIPESFGQVAAWHARTRM
jgi:hypothetical protein